MPKRSTDIFVKAPAEPGRSLSPYSLSVSLHEPFYLAVTFRTQEQRLFAATERADETLAAHHIVAGDLLIFDRLKTEPTDGAIVHLLDREPPVRVARVTPTGISYHLPGYPVLTGSETVYGTLAGVVRHYGGEEADAAEGDDSAA